MAWRCMRAARDAWPKPSAAMGELLDAHKAPALAIAERNGSAPDERDSDDQQRGDPDGAERVHFAEPFRRSCRQTAVTYSRFSSLKIGESLGMPSM